MSGLLLGGGNWLGVHDGDARALGLFKRHYSYRRRASGQARGSPTFIGQGEKIVLLTIDCRALFTWQRSTVDRTSGQIGVNCTVFRNESELRSSDLILEAEQIAWAKWPGARLFTYVDGKKVKSANPGWCFKQAGWANVRDEHGKPARSKTGKLILEKLPATEPKEAP